MRLLRCLFMAHIDLHQFDGYSHLLGTAFLGNIRNPQSAIPSCSIPIGLIFVSPKLNQQLHHRQMATHGSHMDRRSTTLVHLVLICSHLQQITHHLLVVEMKMVRVPHRTNVDFGQQISVNMKKCTKNGPCLSKSRGVHVLPQCAEGLHPNHPTHFGHHPIPQGSEPLPPEGKVEIRKDCDHLPVEARNYSTLNILLTNAPRGCKTIATSATHPHGPESPTCNL